MNGKEVGPEPGPEETMCGLHFACAAQHTHWPNNVHRWRTNAPFLILHSCMVGFSMVNRIIMVLEKVCPW